MNNRISNIVYSLAIGLILTPLFVVPIFLYPFSAKVYLMRFLIIILSGVGLWQLIRTPHIYRNSIHKKNYLLWTLVLFILAWCLSSLTNHTFYIGFWSTAERGMGLVTWIYLLLLLIILETNINNQGKWLSLFKISAYVSLLIILLAILSYFGLYLEKSFYHTRLTGSFGNPLFLAAYLLIQFFITLYLLIYNYQQHHKIKWFYLFICFMQILGIIWTGSRSILLATILGGVMLLIMFICTPTNRFIKKLAIFCLLGLCIVAVGLLCIRNHPFIKNNLILSRFVNFSFADDASIQSRIVNSRIAIAAFKQKPLFGWGPENYFEAFVSNYNREFQRADPGELIFDKAHNMPLEILATGGIILFIPYITLYLVNFWIIYQIWRADKKNNYSIFCFAACLIAYFIASLFLFDMASSLLPLFMIFAYLYFVDRSYSAGTKNCVMINQKVNRADITLKYSCGILLIVFIICGIVSNTKQSIASRYYGFANYYMTGQKTYEVINYLDKAGGLSPYIDRDGVRAGKSNIIAYQTKLSTIDNDQIVHILLKISSRAVSSWQNASGIFDYYRATLYNDLKNPSQEELTIAEGILSHLVDKYPDYIPYRNGLTETYALEGKYQKSIIEADKVIAFTDYYSDPYWYKGVSLNFLGDQQGAFDNLYAAVTRDYNIDEENLSNLIKLAIILGKNKELPLLYQKAIEMDPKNLQNYASLAAAYQKIGDYNNARITAEKMLALDPAVKPQVDAFLKTLPAIK